MLTLVSSVIPVETLQNHTPNIEKLSHVDSFLGVLNYIHISLSLYLYIYIFIHGIYIYIYIFMYTQYIYIMFTYIYIHTYTHIYIYVYSPCDCIYLHSDWFPAIAIHQSPGVQRRELRATQHGADLPAVHLPCHEPGKFMGKSMENLWKTEIYRTSMEDLWKVDG